MWHVAEGDLHAYLDGALDFYPADEAGRIRDHLERCGECRGRLDEQRALRERASAVLEDGAPGEVVPAPLEELRRRAAGVAADGHGSPSTSGPPSHVRWAWAATVVLALGVGWGVGAWRVDDGRTPELSRMDAGARAVVPDDGPGRAGASGDAPAEEVAADADVAATDGAPPAGEVGAGTDGPRLVVAGEAGKAESAGAAVEPGAGIAAAAERPDERAATGEVAAAESLPDIAQRARAALSEERMRGAAPERTAEAAPMGSSPAGAARADSMVWARAVAAGKPAGALPPDEAKAWLTSLGLPDSVALIGYAFDSDGWLVPTAVALEGLAVPAARVLRDVTEQARRQRSDVLREDPPTAAAASLAVPGLEVVGVEWDEVAPGERGVLVRQRLADGTPLELRFVGLRLRAEESGEVERAMRSVAESRQVDSIRRTPLPMAGAPAAARGAAGTAGAAEADAAPVPAHLLSEPLPAGWHQVPVPFRGGWLVVRGPLPEVRLLGLVSGMR